MSHGAASSSPSLGQWIVAQVLLPIGINGLLLPIGLIVLLLAVAGQPIEAAIDRGELFLVGGSAAFSGAVVHGLSESKNTTSAVAMAVLALCVTPSFAAWGYAVVASVSKSHYSHDFVQLGGGVCAVTGISLGFVLAVLAFPGQIRK